MPLWDNGKCVCVCVCARAHAHVRAYMCERMRKRLTVNDNYLELNHSEAYSRNHTIIVFWLRAT